MPWQNPTTLAAWWGAIIATLILLWDFYKWKRSGADVRVTASPNMEEIPAAQDNQTFVAIEAINLGDRPTTITHVVGYYYKTRFHRLFRKSSRTFIVANPHLGVVIPHMLEPGGRWLGGITQDAELEELARQQCLYCGVLHTASKRAVLKRVRIQSTAPSND